MKLLIDKDEWWPVMVVSRFGIEVEVQDELLDEWGLVEKRFKAIQSRLLKLYEDAGGK